jgi:hypothetical protein
MITSPPTKDKEDKRAQFQLSGIREAKSDGTMFRDNK